MKTNIYFTALIYCLSGCLALAATLNLGIDISNGGGLKDNSGTLLSKGVGNVNGDGAVLQIGYYSEGTILDPFLGQWVAITGPGTPYSTTIGDSGRADGLTKTISILEAGTLAFVEPAVGSPLALRFYDSTSIATSAFYNAVAATDGSFTWLAPSDPQSGVGLSLPSSDIVWQDGSGSAFRTTIAIPEPTCSVILALATGLLTLRRRRVKSP